MQAKACKGRAHDAVNWQVHAQHRCMSRQVGTSTPQHTEPTLFNSIQLVASPKPLALPLTSLEPMSKMARSLFSSSTCAWDRFKMELGSVQKESGWQRGRGGHMTQQCGGGDRSARTAHALARPASSASSCSTTQPG